MDPLEIAHTVQAMICITCIFYGLQAAKAGEYRHKDRTASRNGYHRRSFDARINR